MNKFSKTMLAFITWEESLCWVINCCVIRKITELFKSQVAFITGKS